MWSTSMGKGVTGPGRESFDVILSSVCIIKMSSKQMIVLSKCPLSISFGDYLFRLIPILYMESSYVAVMVNVITIQKTANTQL